VELTNDARLDIPGTAICTGYTSEQYKDAVKEGYGFVRGFSELRNVTWVDLPTSHWACGRARRNSPRSSAMSPPAQPGHDEHV
jgi:hypothetical protein